MSSERLALVAQHGADPIATSTLQDGLEYFHAPEGFVAYQRAFGVALSLGGPVCAPEHQVGLARRFMREVPGAALFYVPRALADAVGPLAWRTCLGSDRVLDLTRPGTFEAPTVRSAVRKAARAGFALEELHATGGEERAFLDRVTASALQRSVVPFQMRFLNRPLGGDAGLSRTFALTQRGQRFGYASIDPSFARGQRTGYLLNLLRFEPTALWGVYFAAVQALGDALRAEGVAQLSLGFCPLHQLDLAGTSALTRPQLKWLADRYAGDEYFARLHQMKSQFAGDWVTRWLVTRTPQLATPLLAFLQATGVNLEAVALERLKGWASASAPSAAAA